MLSCARSASRQQPARPMARQTVGLIARRIIGPSACQTNSRAACQTNSRAVFSGSDFSKVRVGSLQLLRCYFELWALFRRYNWVSYRLSNNSPFAHVVSVRLVGNEPAISDQCFGRVEHALPVSDGARAVNMDIAYADGVFGPALKPVEQFLRRRGLLRFPDWWWRLPQSLK